MPEDSDSGTATARKASPYLEPLVIQPSEQHKQTWIVLHGRGSNAQKFGGELLATPIPGYESLQSALPNVKFVFPTAAISRARIYKRSLIHQWFDNWSLLDPEEREEQQSEGLRKTTLFLHQLIKKEIAIIGVENIIFGGLSQGCAAALIATVLWDGDPLGAVFGMCGWLPYCRRLQERAMGIKDNQPVEIVQDDDFFTREDEDTEDSERTPAQKAINFLTDELNLQGKVVASSGWTAGIPIFLGHGIDDDRVPLKLAMEAADCLEGLGFGHDGKKKVGDILRQYEDLGHWYSGKMLADVVDFVKGSMASSLPQHGRDH